MDSDALEALQKRRLERILSHAYDTPYYRKIMDENQLSPAGLVENLAAFPITEKPAIRESPDSFIRKGVSKAGLMPVKTSGSTALPLQVFRDQEMVERITARRYLGEMQCGFGPRDIFAEIVGHYYKPHPLVDAAGLFRKFQLSVFEDEKKNFSLLKKSGANILGWYSSVISFLAKLTLESNTPIRLKSVMCGAEMLTPGRRKLIEESFSCDVFNQYASWEFGIMALECPEEHNLHIASSSCLIEIVDDKGKPKKSGVGRVVATSLDNKAMPLIRYNLDDLSSWGKGCSCGRGSPVLKSLEGRQYNTVVLPSGRVIPAIRVMWVNEVASVYSYRVIQERPDLFVFRYIPGKGFSDSTKKEIANLIKQGCMGEEVNVEFEEVDKMKKGRTGKMEVASSKVPHKRI